MKFNEDTRVKIPALIHLLRLGYSYLSLKGAQWDQETNIFPSLFAYGLKKLNPGIQDDDIARTLRDVTLLLENEDLGKAFFERLQSSGEVKLIDFDHFENNSLHIVTELPCINGDEEFRPDITILVNGMPLAFIEVKKPNNREGILAERNRINIRFNNPKFRRFINITQLMVFSNNMEYDEQAVEPLEGVFYATTAYSDPKFNYFREELNEGLPTLAEVTSEQEDAILKDNNLQAIKHTPEFAKNKSPRTPTNRLSTSLFCPERLSFLLRYGIAYVRQVEGYEKHIMRYPQVFATKAIVTKLAQGLTKGIIWHTQGSGKTALAYYNVRHLTDYYQARGVVPKFYFIVDRLDLMIQAAGEFRRRGLFVHEIDSKQDFARAIKSAKAIHNDSGQLEITVVNIQKFKEDPSVVSQKDYDIGLQRIYFLDEVHRSYNPKGSFLANLNESDPNAIKIGLTGTPLIGKEFDSKSIFGGYIHKYYYNASIKDGYTLRLIREEIATEYKMHLAKALDEAELLSGSGNRKAVYAHSKFVEPMLNYIIEDFERARLMQGDPTIGAMVICDSADQAKEMGRIFEEKYDTKVVPFEAPIPFPGEPHIEDIAEPEKEFTQKEREKAVVKTGALILHDIGTKEWRKDQVDAFKEGKIDILFVYNMLLTGFDSPRLKKLYLGRQIKSHNLLQALTRVNRTYRKFRYGYVVDFADIQSEFEKTNEAYFKELQAELGDEIENYSNLFKTEQEIQSEVEAIKDALWKFDTQNAEVFSQQISQIEDRGEMQKIVKALVASRELYNVIRLSGRYELLDELDFKKLGQLLTEAKNHLALLNQKIALEEGHESANLLNMALEDVLFTFRKVGEGELKIADELRETLRQTRETLSGNFDPRDPEFVTLREELERLFKKKKLSEISQSEMAANIKDLTAIQAKARELNRRNELLRAKYANDAKYARLHKRLLEKYPLSDRERKLCEALNAFKEKADNKILQNTQLLTNESYAEREMLKLAIQELKKQHGFDFSTTELKAINELIMKEYLDEFNGQLPA